MNHAGDRIRKARIDKRLTQDKLAKLIGVTKGAISQWENSDEPSLTGENLLMLAANLDVSPELIVFGQTTQQRTSQIPERFIRLAENIYSLSPKQQQLFEELAAEFIINTGVSKHDEKSSIHRPLPRSHEQPPSEQQLIDDGYEPGDYDLETSGQKTKNKARAKR